MHSQHLPWRSHSTLGQLQLFSLQPAIFPPDTNEISHGHSLPGPQIPAFKAILQNFSILLLPHHRYNPEQSFQILFPIQERLPPHPGQNDYLWLL